MTLNFILTPTSPLLCPPDLHRHFIDILTPRQWRLAWTCSAGNSPPVCTKNFCTFLPLWTLPSSRAPGWRLPKRMCHDERAHPPIAAAVCKCLSEEGVTLGQKVCVDFTWAVSVYADVLSDATWRCKQRCFSYRRLPCSRDPASPVRAAGVWKTQVPEHQQFI